MWGQIFLESSIQQNFNFGFSTHKSDVLLHLSQWQYWWWFWFSLVWVGYYYIIIYCTTKRVYLFNPVLNTSLRGHGKWGDFLVALIPLSWCGNILVNSNFILRMIEWQNESSLFTLRVQGKQWYWVYKFDASTGSSLLAAPKNIGHNRWLTWFLDSSYTSDSYYQAVHLAAQLEFSDSYKTLLTKSNTLKNKLELDTLTTSKTLINLKNLDNKNVYIANNININLLPMKKKKFAQFTPVTLPDVWSLNLKTKKTPTLWGDVTAVLLLDNIKENVFSYFYQVRLKPVISHYDFIKLDDYSDVMGNIRPHNILKNLRLLKAPININNSSLLKTSNIDLITYNIYANNDTSAIKTYQTENLWGFRQKKYKRLKKFLYTESYNYDPVTYKPVSLKSNNLYQIKRMFKPNQIKMLDNVKEDLKILNPYVKVFQQSKPHIDSSFNIQETQSTVVSDPFDYYNAIKNSKQHTDLLSVTLARRLLRVKRTLVLPAHVNITVITNSYDVVHSWFIPGLGLKLDCVPGRSTHHTFYIDNIGFYYGQCAEICGRYHHHMPIRICALSFDQFLVWWHKKGIARLNRLNMQGSEHKSSRYWNALKTNIPNKNINDIVAAKYTYYKYNW